LEGEYCILWSGEVCETRLEKDGVKVNGHSGNRQKVASLQIHRGVSAEGKALKEKGRNSFDRPFRGRTSNTHKMYGKDVL